MSTITTDFIDDTKPAQGLAYTADMRNNFAAIKTEFDHAAADIDGKVAKTGDTLSGSLIFQNNLKVQAYTTGATLVDLVYLNGSNAIYLGSNNAAVSGGVFLRTPSGDINITTIWHSGNDGASSGLDADLLDAQQGSYYLNASNLNAGTLPAARFNDTAHGNRSGGSLHAAATTSVAGFMSAADKTKLDGLSAGLTESGGPYTITGAWTWGTSLTFNNNTGILQKDTGGSSRSIVTLNASDNLYIGLGTASMSTGTTYLYGKNAITLQVSAGTVTVNCTTFKHNFSDVWTGENFPLTITSPAEYSLLVYSGSAWRDSFSTRYHGVMLYNGTAFSSIGSGSTGILDFDSEDWDSDGFHSNSTNPERISAISGTEGYYIFYAYVTFPQAASSTSNIKLELLEGGSTVLATAHGPGTGSAENVTSILISRPLYVGFSNYYTLRLTNNTGSSGAPVAGKGFTGLMMFNVGSGPHTFSPS